MKKPLQKYFNFTRSERRGILYLFFAIMFVLLLPWMASFFIKNDTYDYVEFEGEIERWEDGLLNQDSIKKLKYAKPNQYPHSNNKETEKANEGTALNPFSFDPNKVTKEQLMDLGLPERTVSTLLNFRAKGGKFYEKEDLKKVYGLKDEWYNALAPFVEIGEEVKSDSDNKKKPSDKEPIAAAIPKSYEAETPMFATEDKTKQGKKNPIIVDINTSTEEDFQKVYGIGPTYAQRIVKFRESLGGFVKVEQVSEIYGMPDSTFQKIRPSLKLGTINVRKININTATAEELKTHPYLNWKIANTIVKYKEANGKYTQVADLKKNYAVSEDLYKKLEPYLTVE